MKIAIVSADSPVVLFRIPGATKEQVASYIVGDHDVTVGETVLVQLIDDTRKYALFVPRPPI